MAVLLAATSLPCKALAVSRAHPVRTLRRHLLRAFNIETVIVGAPYIVVEDHLLASLPATAKRLVLFGDTSALGSFKQLRWRNKDAIQSKVSMPRTLARNRADLSLRSMRQTTV